MKNILFIAAIAVQSASLFGQKMERIEFDSLADYDFKKLHTIYYSDIEIANDTIRAELVVNSDTSRSIQLAKAKLKGDTLTISFIQTDSEYHHEFVITIINVRYRIDYRFLMSGDTDNEGYVQRIEAKLKLNTYNFYKGKIIRGYTEFKGRCLDERCFEDLIHVKGKFTVRIE